MNYIDRRKKNETKIDKPVRELTLENVKEYKDYLTVGRLLEYIEKYNIPRDGKILIQRIEDVYFKENNWGVVKKEGFHYHQQKRLNEKVDSGVFNDRKKYPLMDNPEKYKIEEKDMEFLKEQYVVCFSTVKYSDDNNNIYLDAHY